ncbi:hypothetical protein Pint_27103 [Pistacia integerrima]|uniref:Uncharacterized protein n=1 Tax=Pistacia integerrima TaxID=434235 RepID=A0ACC0YNB9_9ROSI|nr:hypothetical protein Pint_27103 [Pistacia integerrima]
MQMPRWKNVLFLKNSFTAPALSTQCSAFFHSTPTSCEKGKNKWNAFADESRAQQPSKTSIRYTIRQKRADAKKALKDLLFTSESTRVSFQNKDHPIWKFDGKSGWDAELDTKGRPNSSSRHLGKSARKKMKRKLKRESVPEDFDDPESIFQERFRSKWYTWSYHRREDSSFQSSSSGFEWREHSNRTNQRTKNWKTLSDTESDDEFCAVGSYSDRKILGLPRRGPLKIEDVKNAFRLSALKWHPDKHQGPSQAMAEEKFKLCANAYKSLCDALSSV